MNKTDAIKTAKVRSRQNPSTPFYVVNDWEDRGSFLVLTDHGIDVDGTAERDIKAVFVDGMDAS